MTSVNQKLATTLPDALPARGSDDELLQLLPEGTTPPPEIPRKLFKVAVETYVGLRRLDMATLADEAGISRRTLYRRVGDREQLLSTVLWFFARRFIGEALRGSKTLRGGARAVSVYQFILKDIYGSSHLYESIQREPEAFMRVILAGNGGIHSRISRFMQDLLALERARGDFESSIPLDALAFAIVRIGESFLYSQVLTGETTNPAHSVEMIGRLLRADPPRKSA